MKDTTIGVSFILQRYEKKRTLSYFWFKVCYGRYEHLKITTMRNSSLCLLSALGGAVLGAAIAMLVTPQSGKELRNKIRAAVNDAAEKLRTAECHCEGEECHCDK